MDFDADESADKLAAALDGETTESEAAALFLSELSKAAGRDERRQLISAVDRLERDGVNLDLIVKRDEGGTPIGYSILPSKLHESAKRMATLMDAGNVYDAIGVADEVKAGFGNNRDENRDQRLGFGRWSIAVDAYEQDGVGEDVSINYYSGRSSNPRYSFRLHRDEV